MNWLLMLIPLGVSSYTLSFGWWVWKQGNRRGAIGIWILVGIILFLAVFLLFFHREYS